MALNPPFLAMAQQLISQMNQGQSSPGTSFWFPNQPDNLMAFSTTTRDCYQCTANAAASGSPAACTEQ